MSLRLHPSPAYPFCLDLAVRYALTDDGLLVTTSATNVGGQAAPDAQGAHPYLTVGGLVDRTAERLCHRHGSRAAGAGQTVSRSWGVRQVR